MVTRQKLSYLSVIAFSVTIMCLPLLLFGPQAGHSLYHNISWAAGFAEQLLAGDLYPRWLMNMNEGAGSPVFFFYAPIPFYFTSLGFLLCGECSTTIQLGIGEWLIILFSSFSYYLFARQYAAPFVSIIGSILYALAPYHFAIDLLLRQAIGEITAYIWIPLILLSIDRMAMGKYSVTALALSYSLLVMTHLPTALFVSIFLLPYVTILQKYTSCPKLISKFFLVSPLESCFLAHT